MMDIELQKKFEKAVRPVIELLRTEMHPHASVRIDTSGFEVSEGIYGNFRMCEEKTVELKEENHG